MGILLLVFLLVDLAREVRGSRNNEADRDKVLYGYSSEPVLKVQNWLSMTPSSDGRKRKLKLLHQAMQTILIEPEGSCFMGFMANTVSNIPLNCFPVHQHVLW